MQKNLPKYTPGLGARRVPVWAEASKREVAYALCDDRRTLLWFGNQRAVEYHPTLARADERDHPTAPHPRPRPAGGRRRSRLAGPARRSWSGRRSPTPGWPAR